MHMLEISCNSQHFHPHKKLKDLLAIILSDIRHSKISHYNKKHLIFGLSDKKRHYIFIFESVSFKAPGVEFIEVEFSTS